MRQWLCAAALLPIFVTGPQARESLIAPATFQIFGAMRDAQPEIVWREKRVVGAGGYAPQKKLRLTIEILTFDRPLPPGSILIRTSERRLYFVLPDGKAMMYPIGVGREGFQWSGSDRISRKAEWPNWRPPAAMIRREEERGHYIPAFMPGGPKNPLGARALYIGSTQFRIHGTTQPWSIGGAVSSGCIRMLNEHVIDLFDRVSVGARVVVE